MMQPFHLALLLINWRKRVNKKMNENARVSRHQFPQIYISRKISIQVFTKFLQSVVPIRDSSLKQITNLCNLSRIVGEAKNDSLELFDLEANNEANIK